MFQWMSEHSLEEHGPAVEHLVCTGAFEAAKVDIWEAGKEDDFGILATVFETIIPDSL